MTPRRRATARALALLLGLAGLAGCASVPASSPVTVLRQVSAGDDAAPPPGPVDGSNPLDLVRDFVTASGSSTDKHGAARRFLSADAARKWDDSAGLTVLDGQIDTVPAPVVAPGDSTTIRIRGTMIGRITPSGSFDPVETTFELDVGVARRDGQWRISRLPNGVVVPLSIFRDNYRTVRTWFVDPTRRTVVADLRYVPSVPARAQAARVMELLLAGPSAALSGAVTTQLGAGAQLRSNVALTADGALVVDLTRVGDLDESGRRLLAAQVVLSLAEVNVARVRLLVDGEPLLPGKLDWYRDDVAPLSSDAAPGADVPALVVNAGKVGRLAGAALPGPVGDSSAGAESAASTADGRRLAVVTRTRGGRTLRVGGGPDGGVAPVPLTARTMTRPSWTPAGDEVWTVLDSSSVARVGIADPGPFRIGRVDVDELTALGPISDLRLSRDGMRVAAVVGEGLYAASVARSIDGEVAVRNVHRLRPADLGPVVAADWRASDSIVAITGGADPQVTTVSVDGLSLTPVLGNNLTPPLTAVAAAPGRPLLVTDQGGVWSFAGGEQDAWRQVLGNAPEAVPNYPG